MDYLTNKETWINPCEKDYVGDKGIHDRHLGGTEQGGDPDGWHPEVWDYLLRSFDIKSVLDIGCGVGTSQLFFERNNVINFGIDGTSLIKPYHKVPKKLKIHDLTIGPYKPDTNYNMIWSCDVFEHIEEQYIDNIFQTMENAQPKIIAFAAAPVGWGGYHHVNCQNPEYWIDKMAEHMPNFLFDSQTTIICRDMCDPKGWGRNQSFFKRSGLVFVRKA